MGWLKTLFSSLTQFLASSAPIPSLSISTSPWSIKWQKLSVQAFLAPWAVSSVRCPCSALPPPLPLCQSAGTLSPWPSLSGVAGGKYYCRDSLSYSGSRSPFYHPPYPTSFSLGRNKAVLCYSNKRNYLLCVEKCYVSEEAEPKETARISESILSATAKLDSYLLYKKGLGRKLVQMSPDGCLRGNLVAKDQFHLSVNVKVSIIGTVQIK